VFSEEQMSTWKLRFLGRTKILKGLAARRAKRSVLQSILYTGSYEFVKENRQENRRSLDLGAVASAGT
jgi:hypothetical protein